MRDGRHVVKQPPTEEEVNYMSCSKECSFCDVGVVLNEVDDLPSFEVEVDSVPVAERGRRGINMTAECRASRSRVVRIPEEEYVGARSGGTPYNKVYVRVRLNDAWLSKSSQEVLRKAAAAKHLEIASEYLK